MLTGPMASRRLPLKPRASFILFRRARASPAMRHDGGRLRAGRRQAIDAEVVEADGFDVLDVGGELGGAGLVRLARVSRGRLRSRVRRARSFVPSSSDTCGCRSSAASAVRRAPSADGGGAGFGEGDVLRRRARRTRSSRRSFSAHGGLPMPRFDLLRCAAAWASKAMRSGLFEAGGGALRRRSSRPARAAEASEAAACWRASRVRRGGRAIRSVQVGEAGFEAGALGLEAAAASALACGR